MKTENVESDFTRLTAFLVKSNLKFVIKEEPCGYLHLNSEKSIILAADSSNSSPIIAYSFDSTGKLRCIKSEITLCDEYIHGFDIYPEKEEENK